jgi:dTDP-4-dehydrorhamnose 3,5-epimerase
VKAAGLEIPGVLYFEPAVWRDVRGFFTEVHHQARYAAAGVPGPFVQDNLSHSRRGVVRGLHFQRTRPQGKLIAVLKGAIWDVVVDLRRGSPAFGRWVGRELSGERHDQLYVPPGCAHGFAVTADEAYVLYKCTDLYAPGDEVGLRWDDPDLAIRWPVESPLLSEKDRKLPSWREIAAGELPTFAAAGHAPPQGSPS